VPTTPPPSRHARPAHPRRAFSLLELLLALSISTTLLAALGSLLVFALRAVPTGSSPAERALSAAAALEQISADLAVAISVTQAAGNAITFTVPDRTGDNIPDTIQYAWNALNSPGEPLYRSVNNAPPTILIPSVEQFTLAYTLRTTTSTSSSSSASSESLLASSDSLLSLTGVVPNGTTALGQTFRPTLPTGTASFSITRIAIRARDDGSQDGSLRIAIRPVDAAGLPTGPTIAQGIINETSLDSSNAFRSVSTPGAVGLPPSTTFAILITSASGTRPAQVFTRLLAAGSANQRYLTSSNNGTSWTSNATGAINFQVYGTTSSNSSSTTTSTAIDAIDIHLRPDPNAAPLQSAVRVINRPTMPAG
jgi:hypothetical protein